MVACKKSWLVFEIRVDIVVNSVKAYKIRMRVSANEMKPQPVGGMHREWRAVLNGEPSKVEGGRKTSIWKRLKTYVAIKASSSARPA